MKKTFGGQCGECTSCGKCEKALQHSTPTKKQEHIECLQNKKNMEIKLYTFIIYSENVPGLLSQITAVYTRRQVNIESLNVCASSTPGVHKYTITANCDEPMAKMLTKQIEKRIDVLQANYYVDKEIFYNETCLMKISTPVMLANKTVSKIVRHHSAHIFEVNPTYAIVEKTGITDDIISLYQELQQIPECILQFVRSGRIGITRDHTEHLDEYLAEREKKHAEIKK